MPGKEPFSIFKHYFDETDKQKLLYGDNTIVLMQVGSFYEIYAVKINDKFVGSHIADIADICDMVISAKKLCYKEHPVFMAGCPIHSIDKFIELIINNDYTAAVYIQQTGDDKTRLLEGVYSSGTYISQQSNPDVLTNNIMCIWFETYSSISKRRSMTKDTMVYGASSVDILTGRSAVFQHETVAEYVTTNFDSLQRFVSVYNPSEVIIVSKFDDKIINQIVSYIGLATTNIHKFNYLVDQKAKNCGKQTYQNELITSYFGVDSYNIYDFKKDNISTQSFCFLLNFIQEHNSNLTKKISLPVINNVSTNMLLANHTLQQLNIIDDNNSKKYGKKSSVMNLLNNCCSTIGKREFKYLITSPTTDENWLKNEYSVMNYVIDEKPDSLVEDMRNNVSKIKDIEKIMRQILMKKLHPSAIYDLYQSIEIIKNAKTTLGNDIEIGKYLVNSHSIDDPYQYIDSCALKIQTFIQTHLKIEECSQMQNSQGYASVNFIQPGISELYDKLSLNYNDSKHKFYDILNYFNRVMSEKEQKEANYVKVHSTEKTGCYLEITTKRSSTLTNHLLSYEIDHNDVPIKIKDIKYGKATANNNKIESHLLKELSSTMKDDEEAIAKESMRVFCEILGKMESSIFDELESMVKYAMRLDILQCKLYNAYKYNYCCPTIEDGSKSFVDAKNMRHCLIEQIQDTETYVPNDVCIGMGDTEHEDKLNGILLYGTNAVGKTSYIRALGISVILAQCGMFVPCSEFVYKPYTSIFSRILGNDNLFRGLSTFAVEISELSVILNLADENSLILGDELCSGTEYQSAISIFVSGLKHMNSMNSSFILATHFHDLVKYEEIRVLKYLAPMHMEVFYNSEKDCLVYDRKLKAGEGNSNYGLEVCKSIHLRNDVLNDAFEFRNKHFAETAGILSYNTSRYNQKKIKGMCEKCGIDVASEVHHLLQQKDADKKGYVGTVHKNHKANLMNLCEKCHNDEHHSSDKQLTRKMKTTSGEYIVM